MSYTVESLAHYDGGGPRGERVKLSYSLQSQPRHKNKYITSLGHDSNVRNLLTISSSLTIVRYLSFDFQTPMVPDPIRGSEGS